MLLFPFTRFHIGKRCFFSTTSRRELLAKTLLTGTFICCFVFGLVPHSRAAQNRAPVVYKWSYYYRAYDQGFRAGRADYDAGRPYGYHAALVTTAGVASISQDYRNAFKLGYQDGYTGHQRGSDWIIDTITMMQTATRMMIVAEITGAAANAMIMASTRAGTSTATTKIRPKIKMMTKIDDWPVILTEGQLTR